MKILDGEKCAEKIRNKIKAEVSTLNRKPGLAAIIVGNNTASKVYVGIKQKRCSEVGIYSERHSLPEKTTEKELLCLIDSLNQNPKIDAILVQMPIPAHISQKRVFEQIGPNKDVDGFCQENVAKIFSGNERGIIPCTPKGIIKLLEENRIRVAGKNAVVIGRSMIVGKPTAMLLLNRDATVTICHSKTRKLKEYTTSADILIAAVGKACLIKKNYVKTGAIIVDVGMNRKDGKLCGDVDFETVKEKASWITPVPGGIGPMTVAMLLENTMECHKRNK